MSLLRVTPRGLELLSPLAAVQRFDLDGNLLHTRRDLWVTHRPARPGAPRRNVRPPTARTLAALAADGWTADIVERRVTNFLTRDLFGVIDVIAVRGPDTLAVQVTSSSNLASRVRKVEESEHLPAMRAAGWRIVCHGWRGDKLTVRDVS